jgi:hypothetical protein
MSNSAGKGRWTKSTVWKLFDMPKLTTYGTSLAPTFMTIKAYSGLTMAIGSSVMSRCETCDLGFGPTAAGLSVHDFRPPETQVICPADLSFGFE